MHGPRALILENIDGFDQPPVFRGAPHILNAALTAPFGLSGNVPTLGEFALGAIVQHAPKRLESWLREQEQGCSGRLHFQLFWLPTNASWLDQIEIWFSLLQRKCLQPNHFVTTTALETALTDYIAYYNQTAKPINWTYTVQKLEQKLGAHL